MKNPVGSLCEDLRAVGEQLLASGFRVTSAGQPWTENCRLWVYFDSVLAVEELRRRHALPSHVVVHENTDPRSGLELGLVCELHHDAVVGLPPPKP